MRSFQFSVRRLMIVVAVVALVIVAARWGVRRWREAEAFYQEALIYHRTNASFWRFSLEDHPLQWVPQPFPRPSPAQIAAAIRHAEYHEAMILKYERAMRCPWLPVAADPPIPE